MHNTNTPFLVIDFDGTLIDGDLLADSIIMNTKNNPFYIVKAIFRAVLGRCYIKHKMHQENDYLNYDQLRYNSTLINYINKQKRKRKEIIICTAANETAVQKIIDEIREHIGVIEVIGSSRKNNLKGRNKAKYLINRYGYKNFDYIGDSRSDIQVWKYANKKFCISFGNSTPSYAITDEIIPILSCKTCFLKKSQ